MLLQNRKFEAFSSVLFEKKKGTINKEKPKSQIYCFEKSKY